MKICQKLLNELANGNAWSVLQCEDRYRGCEHCDYAREVESQEEIDRLLNEARARGERANARRERRQERLVPQDAVGIPEPPDPIVDNANHDNDEQQVHVAEHDDVQDAIEQIINNGLPTINIDGSVLHGTTSTGQLVLDTASINTMNVHEMINADYIQYHHCVACGREIDSNEPLCGECRDAVCMIRYNRPLIADIMNFFLRYHIQLEEMVHFEESRDNTRRAFEAFHLRSAPLREENNNNGQDQATGEEPNLFVGRW